MPEACSRDQEDMLTQLPAPLRVLVCDDSVVIRAAIARILATDPGLHVAARAGNGRDAVEAVKRGGIDVVILDLEMPVMGGIEALPLLLAADPGVRVIVASALTTRGASIAMEALRLGAVDYVPKPGTGEDRAFAEELLAKARGHGTLRRRAPAAGAATAAPIHVASHAARPMPAPPRGPLLPPAIFAIGSSTGGPDALGTVFRAFRRPPRIPLLLTQHMPGPFIPKLADHLSRLGPVPVAEARDGEAIEPGRAYIAPGGNHLLIVQGAGGQATARLWDGPPENSCRPAVDPMLRSLPQVFGGRVGVAILTGMGQDGAAGSGTVVAAGGAVYAQDAATSVVWGMPGAVTEAGHAREVLPLPVLAAKIAEIVGAA
jgi:two-component system chemotaxis response regulator CheB